MFSFSVIASSWKFHSAGTHAHMHTQHLRRSSALPTRRIFLWVQHLDVHWEISSSPGAGRNGFARYLQGASACELLLAYVEFDITPPSFFLVSQSLLFCGFSLPFRGWRPFPILPLRCFPWCFSCHVLRFVQWPNLIWRMSVRKTLDVKRSDHGTSPMQQPVTLAVHERSVHEKSGDAGSSAISILETVFLHPAWNGR